ncbi:Lacal_2735 family protein [Aquimarina mycalae]|uniref:Lacal_2735 family protein n=1 Tax=Aquimarina mycalae TaxID=3040073 RepID=UPI00403AE526
MLNRLRGKTELQKLQSQYCKLVKSSYNLAIKDKDKSDHLHKEAIKILDQIKKIEHQL